MKRLTNFRILVAAIAAAAPLAAAHANDFTSTAWTGYFQEAAAQPKGPDMLALTGGHVRKNMLGWEFITYDNRLGPQGPIREEFNPQASSARSADDAFWQRTMYPIDGYGTE
ncbi:MAG TPA: hypothetical protein VF801_17195 [Rhodocyclaceae bacterium]